MKFCSNCGSDALDYRIPEGDNRSRFICNSCDMVHYVNPNVIVGCLIVENGAIMLAKRGIEPQFGLWNLPCGFLENDETVEEGAIREVLEETGAKVEIEYLHSVYSVPKTNQIYLIFKAHMLDSYYHITPESTDIAFFPFEEIPWDLIAFSSNTFAIRQLIDSHTDAVHTNIGSHPG